MIQCMIVAVINDLNIIENNASENNNNTINDTK